MGFDIIEINLVLIGCDTIKLNLVDDKSQAELILINQDMVIYHPPSVNIPSNWLLLYMKHHFQIVSFPPPSPPHTQILIIICASFPFRFTKCYLP